MSPSASIRKQRPLLVAIVGGSGAGKTWLADRLVEALGGQAYRVNLDDFYRDLSMLTPKERLHVNFDHPRAIDWESVTEVLEAMESGRPARLAQYDYTTHTRRAETRGWEPCPLVIWEGLWLLHPEQLRERFGFSVYVDCPTAERLHRRLERDCRERGRATAEVVRQFAQQVVPMHQWFVEPQKEWTDDRVTSPVSAAVLRRLAQKLEKIVASGGEFRNL